MATIVEFVTRTGNTRYKVVIRLKGQPTQTATFSRRTDAKHWAQTTEAAILEGRHFKTAESKRRTFADMVDRYIEKVVPIRYTKPVVKRTVLGHLEWWKQELGPFALVDITPAKISTLRDTLLATPALDWKRNPILDDDDKHKRLRSPATVVRYLASLSAMYTVAINEWGWAESNPVEMVKRPTEPKGRVRFLSDKEREALLKACKAVDATYLYPIVVLALSTGARQGELLSLTWKQVDLDRQIIRLEETKNKERRGLPLVGYAHKLIAELHNHRRKDTEFVFPRLDGTKPKHIEDLWKSAVKKAGLSDFRFHDLRHCAASYLAMNGATLAEIAEVLGHKTLQMVKRYAHLSDQHTAGVVKRMNAKIFKK